MPSCTDGISNRFFENEPNETCSKKRAKILILHSISWEITPAKEKEKNNWKSEEKRKDNGSILSFTLATLVFGTPWLKFPCGVPNYSHLYRHIEHKINTKIYLFFIRLHLKKKTTVTHGAVWLQHTLEVLWAFLSNNRCYNSKTTSLEFGYRAFLYPLIYFGHV